MIVTMSQLLDMTLDEILQFHREAWYEAQARLEQAQTNRVEINDVNSWEEWYEADEAEREARRKLARIDNIVAEIATSIYQSPKDYLSFGQRDTA